MRHLPLDIIGKDNEGSVVMSRQLWGQQDGRSITLDATPSIKEPLLANRLTTTLPAFRFSYFGLRLGQTRLNTIHPRHLMGVHPQCLA